MGVLDDLADCQRLTKVGACFWECVCLEGRDDPDILQGYDVIALFDPAAPSSVVDEASYSRHHTHLELLQKHQIGVLVLTNRPWMYAGFNAGVVCLPPDSPPEKIHGALLGLSHMRPMIRRVRKQLIAMRRLGKRLRHQLTAADQEMQLAARLQKDFLPKKLPETGPFQFTTMFRPCSWVSGDIFDIFRLDEKHWGFYLADAVGHGVAAGLLTMYIKYAIRPKRILRNGYELVRPSEVLGHLNDLLVAQGLPNAQFISGWYGMVNMDTLKMNYAVAGHPPALLIDTAGSGRELHGDGCLLGINSGVTFSDESVELEPGHRIMVYSDGLEPTLIASRPPMPQPPVFESGIVESLRLPATDMISRLRERLDNTPGSLSQADDVTLVVMDVASRHSEAT